MMDQHHFAQQTAMRFLGDLHPLSDCLGGPDGLSSLAPAAVYLQVHHIDRPDALLRFFRDYRSRILFPLEMPAIAQAYWHTSRSELREFVELDRKLTQEPLLELLAECSQVLGAAQLRRLRPLRDERMVQRYLRAVECGEARAWHTLVYGLILSVYSLPLRQGLIDYAQHTLQGMLKSSTGYLHLSEPDFQQLLHEIVSLLPNQVDSILSQQQPPANPSENET